MIRRFWLSLVCLTSLVGFQGCASTPTTAAACHLTKLASMPVTFIDGLPTMVVKIAGHDEVMLIDTGAFASIITEQTANALGAREFFTDAEVKGTGGLADIAAAHPGDVQIGGILVKDTQFLVVKSLIPHNSKEMAGINGIIGQDILKFYNIGIDFPHGRLDLYATHTCSTAFPFGGYFSSSPTTWTDGQQRLVPISIDQHDFEVLLDTGARTTSMTQAALNRASIHGVVAGEGGRLYGVGQSAEAVTPERFDSVTIGAEEIDNAVLDVDTTSADDRDGILGETYIRTHQIYISADTQTVFFGTAMATQPATP